MSISEDLENALLAVLFTSSEPLNLKKIENIFDQDKTELEDALSSLQKKLSDNGCGIVLKQIAGGWRLFSSSKYSDIVKKYVRSLDSRKLSSAALETLGIIAYSQPVTRANVAAVRGVNSDSSINGLVEKGFVREYGQADLPGNPTLYATTTLFLEHFGLNTIKDLPDIDQFAPDEKTRALIDESLSAAHIDIDISNQDLGIFNEDSDKPLKNDTDNLDPQTTNNSSSDSYNNDSKFVFEEALQSAFGTTEKIDFDKLTLNKDEE